MLARCSAFVGAFPVDVGEQGSSASWPSRSAERWRGAARDLGGLNVLLCRVGDDRSGGNRCCSCLGRCAEAGVDDLVGLDAVRRHGRSTNPSGALSYTQLADDIAALKTALGLVHPVVGGYSDGGQVVLELGARHPDAAGALIVGAAYPDFAASGLREVWKAFLGADDAGTPDLAQVDTTLGDLADHVKSLHPGGEQQWKTLVQQSAPMWLDYQGLTPDNVRRIEAQALVVTGDRDDMIPLDRMVSLYRTLPNAELAVCSGADHFALVAQERTVGMFAEMIREFAGRHGQER
jgi:pimeloyl-ACP methyl ester carboxylesterase